MTARGKPVRVWRMPAVLAALTVAGLGIALYDETQPSRGLAWLLLGIPILTGGLAWAGLWPRRGRLER